MATKRYKATTGYDLITIGDRTAILGGRKPTASSLRRILKNCPTERCTLIIAGKLATPYVAINSSLAADTTGYMGIRLLVSDALADLRGVVGGGPQFVAALRTMTIHYDWSAIYQVTVIGQPQYIPESDQP